MHEAYPAPHERGKGRRGQRPPPFGGREPDADGGAGRALPADSVRDEWAGQPQGRRPVAPGEGEPERAGDGVGTIGAGGPPDRAGSGERYQGVSGPSRLQQPTGGRIGYPDRDFTHFSTFSGIGGLDLGLERAGWRTLAFSEIDPYASAVLAERWPDIPNLGDIVALAGRASREHAPGPSRREPSVREVAGDGPAGLEPEDGPAGSEWDRSAGGRGPHAGSDAAGSGDGASGLRPLQQHPDPGEPDAAEQLRGGLQPCDGGDWRSATLWTGGFPCQDLSIAGKRRGLGLGHGGTDVEATRSGLAFAFLDLLRSTLLDGPGPTYVLLENVPGLLSSHGGRDMAELCGALVDLGYGVAYRTLDARYTGVPQRRRRVFILGVRMQDDDPDGHLAAERAAEILALTASGCGHTQKGRKEGPGSSPAPRTGLEIAGGLTRRYGKGVNTTLDDGALVVGEAADASGDRAPDGAPRRLDDSPRVEGFAQNQRGEVRSTGGISSQLTTGGDKPGEGYPAVYYIAPETGQGADLTAHEVEEAPAITPTEFVKSTDRGIRVVGAFNSTGGTHSVDFDEDLSPPVRIGSGIDIPSPPAVFMRSSSGTGNGLNYTDDEAQPLTAANPGIDAVYVKGKRAQSTEDDESWREGDVSPTVNAFDVGDARATALVAPTVNSNKGGGWRMDADQAESLVESLTTDVEDDLLPPGLDSHRYRACGNAVVVNVAEWLGDRIRLAVEGRI